MATTDVTNTLVANITSTEQSTQNIPINRSTGNPAFASNAGLFSTYQVINALTQLGFPVSPVTQVYLKNLDPAKTILVEWTPNGGARATIITLNPGDQILLWCNPSGTTPGITAIYLTPSAAGCLFEYFFGG